MRCRIIVIMLGLASFAGAACAGETDRAASTEPASGLRIASFDLDESVLLSELYAQAIESTGVPVERLGALGPREIIAPAMELGHIDLVPEYLGTARRFAGASEVILATDVARLDLNERLLPRGLAALAASSAEDKNVFVVTTGLARREGLEKLSDLSKLDDARFGGPPECVDRPLCLAGLEDIYGLQFDEFIPQRSLEFTAEALRRGEIEVGLMFSTASQLVAMDIFELADDKGMQPAENVIPVVRLDALERWGPAVAAALDEVSRTLTTSDLRTMNLRVTTGDAFDVVASDFLIENDLLRAK